MRILMIEDDHAAAQSMELMLKAEGFDVETTDLGEYGVDLARLYDFDAITLDLDLPDISGLEVLRRIRAAKVKTPVVVVTGETGIDTKVKAFAAGADDYLGKPFHKDELVCRVLAVFRRSKGHTAAKIAVGPIVVLLDERRAEVNGARVHLTAKEYRVLEMLALRKGQTMTKELILNNLYGGRDEPEIKIIDVFICKLRTKLKRAGAAGLIQTIWGRGYALQEPMSEAA